MTKFLQLFGISFLFISSVTYAGTAVSGGGGAIVCRDQNKKIISAEMYDLFEGKYVTGLKISTSMTNPELQLENVIDKLASEDYARSELKNTIATLIPNIHYLPLGISLQPPNDMGNETGLIVPAGCAIEGVGYYNSDETLTISSEIYNAFSMTDRAALILHEAMYVLARSDGAMDSAGARHCNAILFSESPSSSQIHHVVISLSLYFKNHGDSNYKLVVVSGSQPHNISVRVVGDNLLKPSKLAMVQVYGYNGYDNCATQDHQYDFNGIVSIPMAHSDCRYFSAYAYVPNEAQNDSSPWVKVEFFDNGNLLISEKHTEFQNDVLGVIYQITFAYPDLKLPSLPQAP